VFTETLPGAGDIRERLRTLPLAVRHYYEDGKRRLGRRVAGL
jgi:hypothetical protein